MTRCPRKPAGLPIPLLSVLLLLILAGCRDAAQPPATSSVPASQPRLFFLGVDGATWEVLGPLLEKGELPAFRRLIEEGAYLPRFDTLRQTHSPVIWTTVATGRRPADHGIRDFTARLPNGREIPVTSSQRKARAIWELASRRGVSVGVIGWWATWPAEEVRPPWPGFLDCRFPPSCRDGRSPRPSAKNSRAPGP